MILPANRSHRSPQGVRPGNRPQGMTLVEVLVTLSVACILMVAVVGFLVNGVISTTKTTAINETTAKGRYVFEHMSRELNRAADLTTVNFTNANPLAPNTYSGFNYR